MLQLNESPGLLCEGIKGLRLGCVQLIMQPGTEISVFGPLETQDEHKTLEVVHLECLQVEILTRLIDTCRVSREIFHVLLRQLEALPAHAKLGLLPLEQELQDIQRLIVRLVLRLGRKNIMRETLMSNGVQTVAQQPSPTLVIQWSSLILEDVRI